MSDVSAQEKAEMVKDGWAAPSFPIVFTMSPGFGGASCAACGTAPGVVRCTGAITEFGPSAGQIKFYLCDRCAEIALKK